MSTASKLTSIIETADAIERYAEAHLFDESGLMLSGIDLQTNAPFARHLITADIVPRRAMFDPWSYWTYEDSAMTAGHYIDGLVMKHELTGDEAALRRAREIWQVYLGVAYQSWASAGIGAFLRPYGGFDRFEAFGEPLGTDQAAPLFLGAWRLLPHLPAAEREETARILLATLTWYADAGFAYRYYKCKQHYWRAPLYHASSYYLPAIAWAARETGDERWQTLLGEKLRFCFTDPQILADERGIARNFKQGGLLALAGLLDEQTFAEHITPDVLQRIYQDVQRMLSIYDEPGMLHRQHAESKEPGFKPYVKSSFNRHRDLGYPFFATVHAGRVRPRHELTVLAALAGLGIEAAADQALDLFNLWRRVPQDFTHFLADEYDSLPPTAHLYGRSIGAIMMDWWRNAWVLRTGLSTVDA